jgi:hypothetical protein
MVVEGILKVFIQGGESVNYDPSSDEIIILEKYSAGLKIKKSDIDKQQLRDLYSKLTEKKKEVNLDKELKEKYGIPINKRLTAKGRTEIAKYQAAIKARSGSKKGSSL